MLPSNTPICILDRRAGYRVFKDKRCYIHTSCSLSDCGWNWRGREKEKDARLQSSSLVSETFTLLVCNTYIILDNYLWLGVKGQERCGGKGIWNTLENREISWKILQKGPLGRTRLSVENIKTILRETGRSGVNWSYCSGEFWWWVCF
jgi:hypothetical protein